MRAMHVLCRRKDWDIDGGAKLWFDQKSLFDPKHFFVNVPGDSLGPDPGTLPKLQAIKKQYL